MIKILLGKYPIELKAYLDLCPDLQSDTLPSELCGVVKKYSGHLMRFFLLFS